MRKNNGKIIIVIIAIMLVLILAGGAFAYVFFYTDLLRNNKQLFFKYALESGEIVEIFKDSKLEEYIAKQEKTPYTSEAKLTLGDTFNTNNLDENANNAMKNTSIAISGITDKGNNYAYRKAKFKYSNAEEMQLEYINMQDYYGFKIADVVTKYIAIENKNLKEFAKKFDLDEATLNQIPDKIDLENLDNLKLSDVFTEEEIEALKTKYTNVLIDSLTDDMFSKSETSDGEVYTLTINKKQQKTIILKLLETLRDDEELINKIKQIITQNSNSSEQEASEQIIGVKESIEEYIENLKEEISNEESTENTDIENNENIVINAYSSNKKLSKIELKAEETSIIMEKKDNEISIVFNVNDNVANLTLEKQTIEESLGYIVTLSLNEKQVLYFSMKYDGLNTLEEVTESFKFKINNENDEILDGILDEIDISNIDYDYTNTKKFSNEISKPDITVNNMLFLNTAPSKANIEKLFDQIGTRTVEINQTKKESVGLASSAAEPIVFYAPALVPVAVMSTIQNSVNLNTVADKGGFYASTLITSLGIMVYTSFGNVHMNNELPTIQNNVNDINNTDGGLTETTPNTSTGSVTETMPNTSTFNTKFAVYEGANKSAQTVKNLIQAVIDSNKTADKDHYVTITFPDSTGVNQTIYSNDGTAIYTQQNTANTVSNDYTYKVTMSKNEAGDINSIVVITE